MCAGSLPCSRLTALEELELFGCPATNAATALQGCRALRRLGLGTRFHALCRRHSLDGGAACGAAYEDVEAGRWEAHYLDSVRSALPWVAHVGAAHAAECG